MTEAALEAMVKTYAAEIETTALRANCFSPGATRTKMRATAMPGEDGMASVQQVKLEIAEIVMLDKRHGQLQGELFIKL